MAQFTNGEWEADAKTIRVSCKVFRTIRVGDIDEGHNITFIPSLHGRTEQELLANTRLIVAAPEMYELLYEVMEELKGYETKISYKKTYYELIQELLDRIDGKETEV